MSLSIKRFRSDVIEDKLFTGGHKLADICVNPKIDIKFPNKLKYSDNDTLCSIEFESPMCSSRGNDQSLQSVLIMHRTFSRIVDVLTKRIGTYKKEYEEVAKVLSDELNAMI